MIGAAGGGESFPRRKGIITYFVFSDGEDFLNRSCVLLAHTGRGARLSCVAMSSSLRRLPLNQGAEELHSRQGHQRAMQVCLINFLFFPRPSWHLWIS
jgi:hypothetical protein